MKNTCEKRYRVLPSARMVCHVVCILLLAVLLHAIPVHAAGGNEKIGLLVGEDAEGNPLTLATGVALQGNGAFLAISGSAVVSEDVIQYYYLSQDGTKYEAEYSGYDSYIGVVMWTLDAQNDSDYFAYCADGYQDEQVQAYYLDSDGYVQLSEGTLKDIVDDGDYFLFETAGLSVSERVDIAVLFDNDGYCLGIVGETGKIWAVSTTQESFYQEEATEEQTTEERTTEENTTRETRDDEDGTGDSGNKDGDKLSTIIVIGVLGAAVIVAAGIIAYKKINRKSPSEQSYSAQMQPPQEQMFYGDPGVVQQQNMMPMTASIPNPVYTGGVSVQICGVGGCMDGMLYDVGAGELLFGRDMSAEVRFPTDTQGVSRVHCKLFWQNGVLMLMDMGSSYGTYLNGEGKLIPRQAVAVKSGDMFYLGEKKNGFIIK